MKLAALTPDDRDRLDLPRNTNGVLVDEVSPASRAEDAGVQPGDVIERVGPNAVRTPGEVAAAIRAAQQQGRAAVALLVRRQGTTAYLGLPLNS